MIVLGCYAIIIHLISFFVLVIRYTFFKGKITPLNGKKNPGKRTSM